MKGRAGRGRGEDVWIRCAQRRDCRDFTPHIASRYSASDFTRTQCGGRDDAHAER